MATVALLGWVCSIVLLLRVRDTRELTARAGHEVRGPLTALALALDALGARGELPADRVAGLHAQIRRAALALDDLCAAPQRRRAPDRPEVLSLSAVVASLSHTWAPVAAARGRELRIVPAEAGTRLFADRTRVSQAAGNLIANALEHGTGRIDVRARVAADRVRLEVLDDGPGLRAPLPAIIRAARGGRGDHGRGLAIADGIARSHGGRLTTAPSGGGAALVLELPLLENALRAEATS
jgi:signal transduction histidine kinase